MEKIAPTLTDPQYLYARSRPGRDEGSSLPSTDGDGLDATPPSAGLVDRADWPTVHHADFPVRSREEIIEHLRKNPRVIETIRGMIRAGKFPGLAPTSEQEMTGMAEEILKDMSVTTAFDPAAAGSCPSAMAGVNAIERLRQIEAAKARGEEVVVLGEEARHMPPMKHLLPLAAAVAAMQTIDDTKPLLHRRRTVRQRGHVMTGVGNRHIAAYQPATEGGIKAAKTAGRNDPCPCGCGKKAKKCEQRKAK